MVSREQIRKNRGWNGNLGRINQVLNSITESMSKKDAGEWEMVVNNYYRFFNDGDFPRIVKRKNVSSYDGEDTVAAALEEILTETISGLMKKYWKEFSANRRRVVDSERLGSLDIAIRTTMEECSVKTMQFWVEKSRIQGVFAGKEAQKDLELMAHLDSGMRGLMTQLGKGNLVHSAAVRGLSQEEHALELEMWRRLQLASAQVATYIQKARAVFALNHKLAA